MIEDSYLDILDKVGLFHRYMYIIFLFIYYYFSHNTLLFYNNSYELFPFLKHEVYLEKVYYFS